MFICYLCIFFGMSVLMCLPIVKSTYFPIVIYICSVYILYVTPLPGLSFLNDVFQRTKRF